VAYQILNPGIELWFAGAGDAVVGFVRHGCTRVVAVAAGLRARTPGRRRR